MNIFQHFVNSFIIIFLYSIVFVQAYFDPGPKVLMSQYDADYRTFDCWDCFATQGRMCMDEDNKSMISTTGSSNLGHGLCCKPDYYDEPCND